VSEGGIDKRDACTDCEEHGYPDTYIAEPFEDILGAYLFRVARNLLPGLAFGRRHVYFERRGCRRIMSQAITPPVIPTLMITPRMVPRRVFSSTAGREFRVMERLATGFP
jgi:hypothetical protein